MPADHPVRLGWRGTQCDREGDYASIGLLSHQLPRLLHRISLLDHRVDPQRGMDFLVTGEDLNVLGLEFRVETKTVLATNATIALSTTIQIRMTATPMA